MPILEGYIERPANSEPWRSPLSEVVNCFDDSHNDTMQYHGAAHRAKVRCCPAPHAFCLFPARRDVERERDPIEVKHNFRRRPVAAICVHATPLRRSAKNTGFQVALEHAVCEAALDCASSYVETRLVYDAHPLLGRPAWGWLTTRQILPRPRCPIASSSHSFPQATTLSPCIGLVEEQQKGFCSRSHSNLRTIASDCLRVALAIGYHRSMLSISDNGDSPV